VSHVHKDPEKFQIQWIAKYPMFAVKMGSAGQVVVEQELPRWDCCASI
jgi:hypothetical protein